MATAYHNLSDYDFSSVPSAEKMKFGIHMPRDYRILFLSYSGKNPDILL